MANDEVAPRQTPRLPKASDVLADEIRGLIIRNGHKPGDSLPPEAELIRLYGYSRATVRESLRLLESDGLISIKRGPKGGIFVTSPDLTQISRSLALLLTIQETTLGSFFEFRKVIEPFAARLAAREPESARVAELIELAEGGPRDPASIANFHGALGACVDNDIIRLLLTVLHEILDIHIRFEAIAEDEVLAVIRAHRRIAQAIADGDGETAERVMRGHLQAFEDYVASQGRLDEPMTPRRQWGSGNGL